MKLVVGGIIKSETIKVSFYCYDLRVLHLYLYFLLFVYIQLLKGRMSSIETVSDVIQNVNRFISTFDS